MQRSRVSACQVIIAGDFDEEELEQCVLRYLGTLPLSPTAERIWADEELYAKLFHLETRQRAVRAKVKSRVRPTMQNAENT